MVETVLWLLTGKREGLCDVIVQNQGTAERN